MSEASVRARVEPARPPFSPQVQARLDAIMPPGAAPLALFTTLARDGRLFERFMSGGLLDRGYLTLRQREVVIGCVTARCGSEYEWGVHVAYFADRAGLSEVQTQAFRDGEVGDRGWTEEDLLLLRFCDSVLDDCDIDDGLWDALRGSFSEEAVLELILLAGFYRTVATLTNVLRLPLEPGAARFAEA